MSQETNLQLDPRNQWDRIVQLLTGHLAWLDSKVRFFIPDVDLGSAAEDTDPRQQVLVRLQALYRRGAWQSLVYCMCMELSLPFDLEVLVLSTSGHEDEYPLRAEAEEGSPLESQLHAGLTHHHQNCGTPPPQKQSRKQQLESVWNFLQQLRGTAQRRFGAAAPGPGGLPAPQQVYIPPILLPPLCAQGGLTSGVPLREESPQVSLQDLFPARPSKGTHVTVLLGQAGMGKTTLAQQLCRTWADGQLQRFRAVFLFEFRLLNLLPRPLALPQLLLDAPLSPEVDPAAVLQYLKEQAEGVLLIFDGLDEAAQPEDPGSPLALFSALCHGTLLRGCQVMATSRPGKLPACLPKDAALVHMWGFDGPRVDEFVGGFFSEQESREVALAELRANDRVRSLCAIPGICQVTCRCLRHLLASCPSGLAAALPPTVTQMYLQLVLILSLQRPLPKDPLLGLGEVALRGMDAGKVIFSTGDICSPVVAFGAVHGLLTSCCVSTGPGRRETCYAFTHFSLQEFFAALYLMASGTVKKEVLAQHMVLCSRWVLRTTTSPRLSDALPAFLAGLASSSCRPFLSQLAQRDEEWLGPRQAAVLQALRQVAAHKLTGPKVVELCRCVEETQDPELADFSAQNMPPHLSFHNFHLTYTDLAAVTSVLGHRKDPIHLEFEGCHLEPCSPRALAGCGQIESLSFKSRKCGDTFAEALSRTLPTMEKLRKLGLSGSKVTARGISCLLEALFLCPQLEEICFQDNQFKDQEVLDIVEGLLSLPHLQKLDLSRNAVSVATLLRLAEVAVSSPAVKMLQVREADLVFLLSSPTETTRDVQGAPDPQQTASQKKETWNLSRSLRLQKCQLRVHDVEILIAHLQKAPQLEEVDLSGNHLEDEGCRLMVEAAARLGIIRKLDLSDNGLSTSGLHCMLRAVSRCQMLVEVDISLKPSANAVFAFTPESEENPQERAASLHGPPMPSELPPCTPKIRLAHCDLQAKHLEQLCKALRRSCSRGDLDFSNNSLRDIGAARLAQLLPGLGPLRSVDLSNNNISRNSVFTLAKCFSALPWPLLLDISLKSQRVVLSADGRDRSPDSAGGSWSALPACTQGSELSSCGPRSFCLEEECQLEPDTLWRLCKVLEPCPGPLEVRLSCQCLSTQSLEMLLQCLPRLPQLSLLRLSVAEGLSPQSPLLLAGLFGLYPHIRKIDVRSLRHLTLHFQASGAPDGGCCGRFTDCSLGPEHVVTLCGSLSKCEDLRELDLSANQLGDAGFGVLIAHLPQMPLTGLLDLSWNSLSPEAVLGLMDALPTCPRVRAALVCLGSENSFQIHVGPGAEAGGTTLRLSQCSFLPDHVPRLASSLSQVLQLTDITLTRCNLGPDQLATLLRLMRTRHGPLSLRVMEPWVGCAGVPVLLDICAQASGNVTEISLIGSQQQLHLQLDAHRSADYEAETRVRLLSGKPLELCARLQRLSLSQVQLCEAACQLLGRLLPPAGLRSFRLTSSYVSSRALTSLVSALGPCHQLEELDVSNCDLDDSNAQVILGALEAKWRLRRLDLSSLPLGRSALAVLIPALRHTSLLQGLWLDGCGLGDVGCLLLAIVLRTARHLVELGLSQNRIGDVGVQHLAALLPKLPELRKIDLSKNDLGPMGGTQVAESLALCKQLEELRLGFNALEERTARALAQGLSQKLRTLHLQSTHLGPAGALNLVLALDGHPCVEEISLAQNSLTSSLQPLHKGLPRLRLIDLISCDIDDQTAETLSANLRLCPALEEILLSWNQLGDQTAAALAKVLPLMDRLKKVDLEKNRITAAGARLLAAGLAQGARLQVIRLWSNLVPVDVAQRLQSQEPRLDFTFFDNQPQVPPDT